MTLVAGPGNSIDQGINPKDLIGVKKAPLRYVPAALALEASGPMQDGAIKYGPYNWRETPILMSGYIEATERHLAALKDGQDLAEDSGHSHIGHIAANMGILADASAYGTLIDDRFKGPAADMLRARDKSAKQNEPLTLVPSGPPDGNGITWMTVRNEPTETEEWSEAEVRHERLLNGQQACCGFTSGHDLGCLQYR